LTLTNGCSKLVSIVKTNKQREYIMYKFVEQLDNELSGATCLPLFEIEVLNTKGETEYITCDIFFKGNSILASRDAVSTKEQRSKYIATSRIVCYSYWTLDQHLQLLHDEILNDIIDGDLYELPN